MQSAKDTALPPPRVLHRVLYRDAATRSGLPLRNRDARSPFLPLRADQARSRFLVIVRALHLEYVLRNPVKADARALGLLPPS